MDNQEKVRSTKMSPEESARADKLWEKIRSTIVSPREEERRLKRSKDIQELINQVNSSCRVTDEIMHQRVGSPQKRPL